MSIFGSILVLWSVLAAPVPAAPELAAPELAAPVPAAPWIDAIELRIDRLPARGVDLESALTFSPGEQLQPSQVRRSLANLAATGRVADASVETRPAPAPAASDHVIVTVVIRTRPWIEEVRFDGEIGVARRVLHGLVELKAGMPYSAEAAARAASAITVRHHAEGYWRARVEWRAMQQPERGGVVLVFEVDRGARAVIGQVAFEGDVAPFDPSELIRATGLEPESPYRQRQVQAAADRLRAWLARQGFRMADVRAAGERWEPGGDQVAVTFPISLGPPVEIAVVGWSSAALRRRGLLPFLESVRYDSAALRQACRRIRRHLQTRGHYRARVECDERTDDAGTVRVRIDIDPGPELTLETIDFQGGSPAATQRWGSLISTTPRRWLRRGSGVLVDEHLDDDLVNLRSYLVLQGHPDATVGPASVTRGRDEGTLALSIPVVEGPRQRIVDVSFSGLENLEREVLLERLPLRPGGGPFHDVLLDESVDWIRGRYEDLGFPEVTIVPTLDWNRDRTLVDVHFTVFEGPRARADRILFRGLRETREGYLRRAVGIQPDSILSRRKLLETERDLYALGVFSRVDLALRPSAELGGRRDVVVTVEEARPWRLGYGVSWHSEDRFGGLFSVSRSNVGGRAGRLQLDLRANRRSQRYRLLFDRRTAGRVPWRWTYTLFFESEERDAFSVRDRGGQLALSRDLGRTRLGVVYDYRLVEQQVPAADPFGVDRSDTEIQISSLTPNLFVERRDDPFSPTAGWTTYLQLEYAFPIFDADADFLELFWQHTHYADLGRFGVLAGSLRLGAIEPLAKDPVAGGLGPVDLPSSRVPISERFFGGGRTSHRAFERDALGIVGQTLVPGLADGTDEPPLVGIGGNGLALLNLDYRFPIAGPVGGTVFLDVGNVWADWRDVDPSEAELGLGIGLRYRSPIGPLRLEVGWKIDSRLPGDDPVVLLSFGNPF